MKIIAFQLLALFHLLRTTTSRERNCTVSGHKCTSTVKGNSYPCKAHPNDPSSCQRVDLFVRPQCDYCPELYDAVIQGPSYRPNITACRQEDGFYLCKNGGSTVNCIRRQWITQIAACHVFSEHITGNINCTDDEMECRPQKHCIKRYDINSDFPCTTEPRKFYIRCHDDEFECKLSRKCLPRDWVRDGSVDCSVVGKRKVKDTSDEDQQLISCNPQTEFRCQDGNGRCIPREMVMDGRPNCPDSSDEKQALKCHNQTEFRCEIQGRCVRRYRVNDGFPDCPKGTDENLSKFNCNNQTEFDCGDGRCIPRSWVGNSLLDCKSGIDERTNLSKCLKNEFMCRDGSRCLPKKYLCDGIKNCADCSDEVEFCDEPRRFRCRNDPSVCLPWSHTCDKAIDCKDGSEENTNLLQGFKCVNNGKTCYVPQFILKNNISMCTDSSDTCFDDKGNFLCARCLDGKRIIAKNQICDGIIDCKDLSDECPCESSKAKKVCDEIFPVSKYNREKSRNLTDIRIKVNVVCNGVKDWENNLDEMFCPGMDNTTYNGKTKSSTGLKNYTCNKISALATKLAAKFGILSHLKTLVSPKAVKCDGRIECLFFDDECSDDCTTKPEYCSSTSIHPWELIHGKSVLIRTCQNTSKAELFNKGLLPQWICDGMQHCKGGEDEHNCTDRVYCDAGSGLSLVSGRKPILSIPKQQECDLKADCLDSKDEMNCSDTTHFYCKGKDPLFIDKKKKFLDGYADCKDYSDECPIELFAQNIFSSPTELLSSIVLKVFIWIVAMASVLGNLWVIITTIKELGSIEDKSSTGYCNRMLIVNLATADFLTGICLWILIVKSIQFSGEYCMHDVQWKMSLTCNMIGILLVISSETSLNMIIILTGLRLFTIIRPMRSKTIKHKYFVFITIASWLFSMVLAFYPVFQKHTFLTKRKIVKNSFFNNTLVDKETLNNYYETTKLINSLGNNSLFSSSDYLTSKAAKSFFPQRHVHVEGVYGYYSSNSVCFPNYFNLSTTENYFSLGVIIYNTAAILFVMVSYVIFYKKASFQTIATKSDLHIKRNETLKNRITVLVLTSAACWLPICVMALYASFAHKKDSLPEVAYVIAAVVLLPIDSCFNPILYSEVHVKIYNAIRNLCPQSERTKTGNTSYVSSKTKLTSIK